MALASTVLGQQIEQGDPQRFANAKHLPEAELLPRLLPIEQLARFGVSKPYQVEGITTFDSGSVLVASEIVFAPGSQLVMASRPSAEQGVYVVAHRITILPGQPAPVISWLGTAMMEQRSPPPVGKAQPGAAGFDGRQGGRGNDGAPGNSGLNGKTPPELYLSVTEIVGGSLNVDWRGQDGGPGGQGQEGGDGGNGGAGHPASSSAFDCRRGPGNGGPGGNGGNGGLGGEGGRGGDGGVVVLLAANDSIPHLTERLVVDVAPGIGGFGGLGGKAGLAGRGGPPGQSAPPWCRADAKPGEDGQPGNIGMSLLDKRGAQGVVGQLFVGELTPSQAKAAVGLSQ